MSQAAANASPSDSQYHLEAVRRNGLALFHVPLPLCTAELCDIAVRQCGLALFHVPPALRTAELCDVAVRQNGQALASVPPLLCTADLCEIAVRQTGWALQSVPAHLCTAELCNIAVRQNGLALGFVPEALRTLDMCQVAVRQNAFAISSVPERLLAKVQTQAKLQDVEADALLAEVARRGLLVQLQGAVGALYDHLERTGALDAESNMTPYLAYRLRREESKLTDVGAVRGNCGYWQQKIDELEACGPEEAPATGAAKAPRVLVVVTGGVAATVGDPEADVHVFDWDDWADNPADGARVPQRFEDLAEPLGIPVQGQESDEVFVRPRGGA